MRMCVLITLAWWFFWLRSSELVQLWSTYSARSALITSKAFRAAHQSDQIRNLPLRKNEGACDDGKATGPDDPKKRYHLHG